MNLAPLYDYLNVVNGRYGIAVVGAAVFFLGAVEIFSKPGKRSSLSHFMVSAALLAVVWIGAIFPFFVFYKSFSGERYEFWPLTFSLFLGLYTFCSAGILSQAWTGDLRGVRIFLILAFVACIMMSLMLAGVVRLFENFHPLWN